jgi:hypothetical protein
MANTAATAIPAPAVMILLPASTGRPRFGHVH